MKTWFERLLDALLGGWAESQAGKVSPGIVPGSGFGISIPFGGISDDDYAANEAEQRAAVVAYCRRQLGEPYRLGAEGPAGSDLDEWDCSELVLHAYAAAGLSIADGSSYQFDFCSPVMIPRPGDLGFKWSDTWGRIGHVVVYTGDGTIVEARGRPVGMVQEVPEGEHYGPRWRGWRRHPGFARPKEDRT